MNAKSENIRDSFVDQLSNLEDRLDDKADDVEMLAEIQEGIGRLLGSSGASEAEIRRVLQERYENGDLRKETFQLVKSMLDRFVTEQIPTSSAMYDATVRIEPRISNNLEECPPANDDPTTSTAVIPAVDSIEPDSADSRVQIGSLLRDRFMLQERVTGGSMGVVYKAMDRRLAEAGADSHWVAVKVLSSQLSQNGQALRALQQEAAKGRCLVHPNIVRFVDLDRDDDLYFIVMEWLEGRTLADVLDSPDSGSIDTERAFKIVRQLGKALDYAHRCGIVHADVKPGNVMIAPNGDAKLFDFGVARVRQKQLDFDPDFDPGVLGLLTPAYSSMQVLTGEKPTPADDVFSLACLLYRLIAGYRVFGPRNAAEAAEEGMKPQRLDKLSDANWRVLKKALSYSRVTRFNSMTDFIDALDVEAAESITVDIPAPARFTEPDESSSTGRVIIGFVVLLALLGVAGNQLGWLDPLKDRFMIQDSPELLPEAADVESIAPEIVTTDAEEPVVDAIVPDSVVEAATGSEFLAAVEDVEAVAIPQPEVIAVPLVDFSKLPPPTAEVRISTDAGNTESVTVTLREDGRTATVDLVRTMVEFPLTLRLEEAGFSGNRSPWASGQYEFSDNGYVDFPVGQDRARVTLAMRSDAVREADQQSTLRVRESDTATSELAIINVVLQDDDQRAFEATLPVNTVAFATSQVTVNEQDPAVQLEIIRFNPDNTQLVVGYALRDITATQGEDYFAPGNTTIEFGPKQRSTRLLIPLVQDSAYEDNEAFSVELSSADSAADVGVFRRVAIMIRDDDQ
ncbi:MAG: protein kinase [Gammaproteobacteria bacterium]|nr:protein kinase [Gammaproteobacteria bacterium]